MRSDRRGFSLLEIIVAIAVMSILAAAIVPLAFRQIDQARFTRMSQDLQAIYEATMGSPSENYFGYVGDVGGLPDSVPQLLDSVGLGPGWNGPYLSRGASLSPRDLYGNPYVVDTVQIRVRSFGADGADNDGGGDDRFYPDNALSTFKGQLEVQVYINGRLITDATSEQVSAQISYYVLGVQTTMILLFDFSRMVFGLSAPLHQGIHELSVNAAKAVVDPPTSVIQRVTILAGSTSRVQVYLEDADYPLRADTDINGNGIPDRMEDNDGDGVPNSMDPDIDGDGTPNAIDPDSLNPLISNPGGSGVAPIVSNVTPSFGQQGATNMLLTIDGQYFFIDATVNFSSSGITVIGTPTWVSGSQIQVNVDIAAGAPTGLRNVTVTNPGGASGTGNNKFEVLAAGGTPSPLISQVVPANAAQGESGLLVTIQGQNFISGCAVTFSNTGISVVSTSFVSTSQVSVTINISPGATPSAGTLRLANPGGQFAESAFTVTSVRPYIALINPAQARRQTQNVQITLTGSGFLAGSQVTSGATQLTIDSYTYISPTELRFQADCANVLIDREVPVYVTNPGGAQDTTTFTITRN